MTRVGIYLYDDVEVLDFAGPFEVFCTAARVHQRSHPDVRLFEVFTVGLRSEPIRARGGLFVKPIYGIDNHPPIDLLIIPGVSLPPRWRSQR